MLLKRKEYLGLPRRREVIFGLPDPEPRSHEMRRQWRAALRSFNAQHKAGRQHIGPLTRTTLDVADALASFGATSGVCHPSYETMAAAVVKGGCSRASVYRALKALEEAGFIDWLNRIKRQVVKEVDDLLGHACAVIKVVRASNAYRFLNPMRKAVPQPALALAHAYSSKSQNAPQPDSDILSFLEPTLQTAFTRLQTLIIKPKG
jgi:radical SAM superfamily enzyme with C-terminal helix-hairpin-helix motif